MLWCVWFSKKDDGDEKGGFSTFSGYLCNLAGEIPAVSDHIVVHNYIFTITQVSITTTTTTIPTAAAAAVATVVLKRTSPHPVVLLTSYCSNICDTFVAPLPPPIKADERRILEVRAERIDDDDSESGDGSDSDDSDDSDDERGGDTHDDDGKG